MPIVFVHTKVIPSENGTVAIVLGLLGALLVYGSLIVYIKFFKKGEDEF